MCPRSLRCCWVTPQQVSSILSSLLCSILLIFVILRLAYLCTDLSPLASLATTLTATSNSVLLSPIITDLTDSLLPRCHHAVDLLVFNPPYVETISEEVEAAQKDEERLIEKSWAGGADGMEVTNRLLEQVNDLLSPRGVFYLVTVKENKPEEIIERMKSQGLTGEVSPIIFRW